MSAPTADDWAALTRRVDSLAERRTLAGDRLNILSDRLAGVEHRQGDVYRVLDRLVDTVNLLEVRLSGVEATTNAILAFLQEGQGQ